MASNIEVKITADIVDLRAKYAIASAETRALAAEVNKASRQIAQSGMTDELKAGLTQSTQAMLAAEAKTKELGAALRAAGGSASGFHGSISTATREFRALFDELSSGRTRMVPGTLAIIAQRVLGIGPAALGAVAGVGVLAGAFAALYIDATKAAEAVGKIKLFADFAGDAKLADAQIEIITNDMAAMPGVARSAAMETIHEFEQIGVRGAIALEGLGAATVRYSMVTGTELPEATKRLTQILEQQNLSVETLQKTFPGLSSAEAENFIQVQKLGDQNKTAAALIRLVEERSRSGREQWDENTGAISRNWNSMQIWLGAIEGFRSAQDAQRQQLQTNKNLWDENTAAMLNYAKALAALPADTGPAFNKDVAAAAGSTHGRMQQLRDDIARFQKDLSDPRATDEEKANFRSMIEDDKRQLDNLENRKSASERQGISEAKRAHEEELQDYRQFESEIAQMQRDDLSNAISIERLKLQTSTQLAQDDFENSRITAQRKFQILLDAAQKEHDISVKALQDDMANGVTSIVQANKDADEILLIDEQLKERRAQLQRELTADEKSEIVKRIAAEKAMANELLSAEDQLVSNIFTSNQTLSQDLLQMGEQLLEKELANDLKAATIRLLYTQEEIAAEKSLQLGGLLFHSFTETQKTAQTAASQTAQTGAVIAGSQARTAAEVTAQAESATAQATSGSAQIMNDALKAAAGAYQAVVGIPIVGPILAPIAAGAAFTAVAAFDTLTSAQSGEYRVPYDGKAYALHADEAVMPRQIANPMRDFFSDDRVRDMIASAGGGNRGPGRITPSVHMPVSLAITAVDSKDVYAHFGSARGRKFLVDAISEAYRSGIRPKSRFSAFG